MVKGFGEPVTGTGNAKRADGKSMVKPRNLIGRTFRGDPSKFYDIDGVSLRKGDFLAARCVMNNNLPV